MNCQKLLFQVFGLFLAILLSVSCGTSSVSIAPTATPTTELSTATPTPEPSTATPTETPEPTGTPTSTSTSTPTPTATSTSTETPEPTPTGTPTPIPVPTHTLSGTVFFDYNGNGFQDEQEPLLEGIGVTVQSITEKPDQEKLEWVLQTDIAGQYRIASVPAASYIIGISSTGSQSFGYILPSKMEAIPIAQGLRFEVVADAQLDIPLAMGSHILPFPLGAGYEIGTWYDKDPAPGHVANWMGETGSAHSVEGTSALYSHIKVEDGHYAIDWVFNQETPIVSCDAGTVLKIFQDTSQMDPNDHVIHIKTVTGLILDMGHINPVDGLYVGQEVVRGELIGYTALVNYPPPFDQPNRYLVHVGFVPPECREYGPCLRDPYPDLWTTTDFDMARTNFNQ